MEEADDPETRHFVREYLSYSRLVGLALWQAGVRLVSDLARVADYMTRFTGAAAGADSHHQSLNRVGRLFASVASVASYARLSMPQQTNASVMYPIDGRTSGEFLSFTYLLMFYFLNELTNADSTSQINVCNDNLETVVTDVSDVALIYSDFQAWRRYPLLINNIKPVVFAHVSLLELLYPTSDSCARVDNELYSFFTRYDSFMQGSANT